MYWSDIFYILTIILFIVSLICSGIVKSRFNRYAKDRTCNGMTGAMAAERILRANGIETTPEKEEDVVRMMKLKVIEYTDNEGNKKKRNVSFVSDLWPLCRFFFVAPQAFDREDKFVRKNWKETTAEEMKQFKRQLQETEDFSTEGLRQKIDPWAEETGIRPWNAWRICLVGEGQGPDMYELAAFLGKDETLRRIENAIQQLG